MRFTLSLSRDTAAQPSPRVRAVAAMFGLGDDASRTQTIVPPTTLELSPSRIVFITGPSGGGKSSILKLIREEARDRRDVRVIDLYELPALPDEPLIDALATVIEPTNRTRDTCDARDTCSTCDIRNDEQPAGLHRALRPLSLAGLSDAFVILRRPRELSDGQRCRVNLAHAFALAAPNVAAASVPINDSRAGDDDDQPRPTLTLILADEFGATLDRLTAKVIAQNVRRWIDKRTPHVCFVAATTHDDLIDALAPDVVIEKDLGDAIRVHDSRRLRLRAHDRTTQRATNPSKASNQRSMRDERVLDERATKEEDAKHARRPLATDHELVIRRSREAASGDAIVNQLRLRTGSMTDYHALAPFHYRASKPATVSRILALRDESPSSLGRWLGEQPRPRTAAVLIESRPMLDCRGRDAALGGRYRLRDRRQRAALINAELRCISRVIIHPQWRGLGLATRLVRAALATATTAYTEAIAAMGRVHPFFERAGMTAYDLPHPRRDARLVAALERAGLQTHDLMNAEVATKRVAARSDEQRAWLVDELRRCCRAARVDAGADCDEGTRGRASGVERVSAESRAGEESQRAREAASGGESRRACEAASGELLALLDAAGRRLLFRPVYYLHDNR